MKPRQLLHSAPYVALTAIIVSIMYGCGGGLRRIDAKTRRLLDERTQALGGGSITPDRSFPDNVPLDREATAKHPPSVNPGADELSYTPADEARDLTARLEGFTRQAVEGAPGTVSLDLDLPSAWRLSQRTGREFLSAEEDYILAAIGLLVERHLWSPRFFNDTAVSVGGTGSDGSFDSALRVINELRVTQRLPYGGDVAARWVWDATEQLRTQATGDYTQASRLVFDGNIPLLRGAGLVAQESLIQAERDLVYAARGFEDFRRSYLVDIATDYFDLAQSQAEIKNQQEQLKSLRLTERAETARYEAGRIRLFQKNIATNQRVTAEASLASQEEQYILQLDRFKLRLGIDTDRPLLIAPIRLELADPAVSLDEASAAALNYRLDLQTRRDQLEDASRDVANARNDALPNLDLAAGVSIPTNPGDEQGELGFSPGDLNYTASATFGLPLDRQIERARIRQTVIAFERAQRNYDEFRDNILVNVRQAVRQIDLQRFQLRLAEERVKIDQSRVRELELKPGQVDTQTKIDAENSLLDSLNARDQAITNLRIAILQYLLQSGQLRVARDGAFQPLPGMPEALEPVPPEEPGFPDPAPGEGAGVEGR